MNWALLFYSQHYLHLLQSHIMATDSFFFFYSPGTWAPGGRHFTEQRPVKLGSCVSEILLTKVQQLLFLHIVILHPNKHTPQKSPLVSTAC